MWIEHSLRYKAVACSVVSNIGYASIGRFNYPTQAHCQSSMRIDFASIRCFSSGLINGVGNFSSTVVFSAVSNLLYTGKINTMTLCLVYFMLVDANSNLHLQIVLLKRWCIKNILVWNCVMHYTNADNCKRWHITPDFMFSFDGNWLIFILSFICVHYYIHHHIFYYLLISLSIFYYQHETTQELGNIPEVELTPLKLLVHTFKRMEH